ncbi:MAG: hypothetical protein V2B18_18855 [Pseudomonadota bacterium]
MNLCFPDGRKSCVACCGLYNVPDGTRASLLSRLDERTDLFRKVERTPDAITEYEGVIRSQDPALPLDDTIHVCEFTGFVDEERRTPGCLLHPLAAGNEGIDLRGLCYYGSMACKSFYCPSWSDLHPDRKRITAEAIDDWHLHGLVATDLDFVDSVFEIIEQMLGEAVDPDRLMSGPGLEVLREIFGWKDAWPWAGESRLRRNRYFFRKSVLWRGDLAEHVEILLTALRHTYQIRGEMPGAEEYVTDAAERFRAAYSR